MENQKKHEGSFKILRLLTVPDKIKQFNLTDHEIKLTRNLTSEKLHRPGKMKELVAVQSLE